ncbi:hypothetical protein ABC255_09575 [Neobacillus sp. 3P2-tot-E-2]|uniref:hypothetical protein n=1 Tax=Neobacillus sp. 3P2-tot-E-2 TaxID=3132212 RepID=UPI0039A1968B
MGEDWKYGRTKELKMKVYALTEERLMALIIKHEVRGWTRASEIKPCERGVGCMMVWKRP